MSSRAAEVITALTAGVVTACLVGMIELIRAAVEHDVERPTIPLLGGVLAAIMVLLFLRAM